MDEAAGEYVVDGRISRVCGAGLYLVGARVSIVAARERWYVVEGRISTEATILTEATVAARA